MTVTYDLPRGPESKDERHESFLNTIFQLEWFFQYVPHWEGDASCRARKNVWILLRLSGDKSDSLLPFGLEKGQPVVAYKWGSRISILEDRWVRDGSSWCWGVKMHLYRNLHNWSGVGSPKSPLAAFTASHSHALPDLLRKRSWREIGKHLELQEPWMIME